MASKKSKLRVVSLGGLQEIGKNITILECGNDIIAIDCGVAFPEDDMLGIDLVIPDFSYLVKNKQKVRGVFLTHGHEDHIGALPYFLKELDVPVYGTRLTLGLLESKFKEHGLTPTTNVVEYGNLIDVGKFKVEFIRVTHSIADSAALAIQTPVGTLVHSGDFKVDYTPIHGEPIDLARFAELGRKGVKLFMCESTNVASQGYAMSERSIGPIFEKIFIESPHNRIMVATFSSNIHRIQQIVNCAIKHHRKVCFIGRSMLNAVKTSVELGYLDIPKNLQIEPYEIKNFSDEQLVIITTGTQGEPMAALSRIAAREHKQVEVKPGDKIIISASPIPGNEKTISKVINELMKKGANVIYEGLMDVHVSGHAKQEEIKLLHALLKPKYLMPIHGEYRHLSMHKELALSMGMKQENIFVMDIGDVLEISDAEAKINGEIPSGQVFVDGLGVGDVGNIVLRDRRILSQDGLIIIVLTTEKATGEMLSGPDIISRGFVYVRESEDLMEEARTIVQKAIDGCEMKNISEWQYVKGVIKDALREYLWQKTKRNPMILPIIMEV
ncbi:MAG: ribonuclease J [Defluviitaleaceae bacterium]|nr:ribonuclease J [Defluviitaleaceae bacterium]